MEKDTLIMQEQDVLRVCGIITHALTKHAIKKELGVAALFNVIINQIQYKDISENTKKSIETALGLYFEEVGLKFARASSDEKTTEPQEKGPLSSEYLVLVAAQQMDYIMQADERITKQQWACMFFSRYTSICLMDDVPYEEFARMTLEVVQSSKDFWCKKEGGI